MMSYSEVEEALRAMTDSERAKMAADLLNGMEPTLNNFQTFFSELNEETHREVVAAAADDHDRWNETVIPGDNPAPDATRLEDNDIPF